MEIVQVAGGQRLHPLQHDVEVLGRNRLHDVGAHADRPHPNEVGGSGRDGDRRGGRPNPIAELLPVSHQVPRPGKEVQPPRQVEHVGLSGLRPASGHLEVVVDPRAHVERRHANLVPLGEPEPEHGVDDGERLDRLHRIEVGALPLVDEVEARPDDANAADAASGQQPVGEKDRKRLLDAEAGIDRSVRGEPAVLEERRPRRVAHGLFANEIDLPAGTRRSRVPSRRRATRGAAAWRPWRRNRSTAVRRRRGRTRAAHSPLETTGRR